eukprot:s3100_g16.t1
MQMSLWFLLKVLLVCLRTPLLSKNPCCRWRCWLELVRRLLHQRYQHLPCQLFSQPLESEVEAPIENLFGDYDHEGLRSYLEGLGSDVSQELYDPGPDDTEYGEGIPEDIGIYAQIFGGDDTFGLPTPDTWMPAPAMLPFSAEPEEVGSRMTIDPQIRQAAVGMPVFARYVKALSDRDYAATQDLAWTKALACKDLQLYVNWADKHSVQWWPLEEGKLLSYMDFVEGASKTKFIGKNLVHALKFFKYLFGAEFDVDLVCGPLLKGRVSRVLATREPTEQARALSVEEVKLLEDKLRTATNLYDKYFIGCMLFALYSRARWGDMSSMQSLELDAIQVGDGPFGFIEAKTRIHKTSSSEERKAMFMPYAALIRGIGEVPWTMGIGMGEGLDSLAPPARGHPIWAHL